MTGGVVLVEGESDRVAVEALARRLGLQGIAVVPIGGAHSIGRYVDKFEGVPVGLCDAGEAPIFRRALEHVFVCDADLEDELIRALGTERVEEILADNGDLGSFRTLQKQAVWRDRPVRDQLRRFFGSGARRKIRYAAILVDALDLERMPDPLIAALRTYVRITLGPSQMKL
ncbi:MAG: TOPRIM nucleotidyl transferase/hydrolase domain-containing protein [Gaiellaceae bacterium]